LQALILALNRNAPIQESGVDRFVRSDTQSIKQPKEMEYWRCN